jgi:phospholipid/cholesterol/gamma-HCH transport system ATP-binding protein
MSESDDVLIRLENVHRSFGGKRVLQGLDLSVRRGETYVIIGRSGTGKSVTLKHIVGLLKPHKGRVLVDGRNVPDMDVEELREFRKRFGYLFQSGALINWMTVGENVALPLLEHTKLEPRVIRVKVREALGMVGLEGVEGLAPSDLSGGMKKRVGLARAIISEPEILLYDEPTTGLDPVTTAIIDRQIDRLQEKLGVTSIVVSHDMASAFRVTGRNGRIGMLFEGRLIAEGTADEIRGTLEIRLSGSSSRARSTGRSTSSRRTSARWRSSAPASTARGGGRDPGSSSGSRRTPTRRRRNPKGSSPWAPRASSWSAWSSSACCCCSGSSRSC